jgi:glycerol kinase
MLHVVAQAGKRLPAGMECIGAIDQGTQSTRFFLYDKECHPIASSQIEFKQLYPKSGCAPLGRLWVAPCRARAHVA